jgi:hypothetical protein
MGRRYYTAQKIGQTRARLVANAGYVQPTAVAEDVSRSTVTRWRDGVLPSHVDPAEVERETAQARRELAEAFTQLATQGTRRALELLSDPKTSALGAATVAAIGIDKANLLTGHATERIEMDLATFLSRAMSGKRTEEPPAALPAA